MSKRTRINRRRKHIVVTIAAGTTFMGLVGAFFLYGFMNQDEYKPGQDMDGLTADLNRDLPPDYPRIQLLDVSAEAGVVFTHFHGSRSSQLPEDMGSGAAWGDYDNDGYVDLFIANFAGSIDMSPEEVEASPARCALFHNEGNGQFKEVAEEAGLDLRAFANGAAWGDYDGDGLIDLIVTTWGENHLYRNVDGSHFEETSAEAGLAGLEGFWTGASWGDYDGDGDLDLYISGYVHYSKDAAGMGSQQYAVDQPPSLNPSSFKPMRNLLLRNTGKGSFKEVAAPAGVLGERGRSLSAAWCDLDGDGHSELYVANDVSDNELYRNQGNGSFSDISHEAAVADYRGAMGLATGDWDSDGDTDIFVTHWIAQENALYSNQAQSRSDDQTRPPLRFRDEADRFGLGQIALDYISWGTSFEDFDNDGRLDLFVVTGSTFQQRDNPKELIGMPDQLFWNRGAEEGFYDLSSIAGPHFSRELGGRGAAFADYDQDGDMDAVIVNHAGPAVLLRNEGGSNKSWIELRLKAQGPNSRAIGARVELFVGDLIQLRIVGGQSSYLSQNDVVQHFGLGDATKVDKIVVRWPRGHVDELQDVDAGQILDLTEGEQAP